MSRTSTFRFLAPALAALALFVALGPASAPADAAVGPMSTDLRIVTPTDVASTVTVSGRIPMPMRKPRNEPTRS